ncbi:uncharacterized protein LOC129787959 isoform X1 [Lutzomyia longipalpis]|uniref:uncharacterized protein LOC129787959 isoform X1 n=1 Tax=Lutzomyia longipalpis TaxID=7200 RepID=UPI002483B4B6|nr:uncharacterized protein LOC129787959 isoform X1 [Lutzomyia longipalpis]
MMSTLPSCMDRYMNRYMVPATQTHHHVPNHQATPPQPPVGQPYFHQTATVANGAAGVAASTTIVPPPNQANNTGGGTFMMNCYQNANGWTGVPLISTASRRPRKQQQPHHQMPPSSNKPPPPTQQTTNNNAQNVDFDETAMSRLAIHAHGAPLILANRGYRKPPLVRHPQPPSAVVMQKVPQQCFVATQRLDDFGGNIYENGNRQLLQPATTPHDTFSMVNSDESSSTSSSNSHTPDTCLPRIIKPRKRRKKERKPNACQNPNVPLHGAGKNNCPNANNGVSLMKSLPLVTSTATQTTTIHEMVEKNSTNVMSMMSAQDEPQFAGDAAEGTGGGGGDEVIEEMSSCSCRLCDPFCRIWAFPLRRSCSDNSGEVEATRRNVGVIGSHIKSSSARNEWRSTPQLCNQQQQQQQVYGHTIDGSRKGSLSDSGDSGCDLLSGLHFATDDLLNIVDCGANGAKATPPPSNSDNSVCDFLLTDNCWEILSRRVMESLDLRSDDDEQPCSPMGGGIAPSAAAKVPAISDCVSSDSGSVFSDSVFSDGIPECYTTPSTNYQHNDTQDLHLGVQIANLLLDQPQLPVFSDCFMAQQFIGGANSPQRSKAPGVNMFGTPLYLQEKDRGNEILSCIDMVWNGTLQLMPVEE